MKFEKWINWFIEQWAGYGRPHAIQLSSFHFNLLFRMGRLIEKKKELTADAALVESINLLFLCGWVMGRSAANGSAQRRKQRRLIGDPAFLSLFHQLCWLRREMRWLVWIAALLSSSSLWGYGAGHRPMLRKERENEDKKRAARQNQQLRRKRKVAQRLQANQQQTFLLHEEKSEVVDGVACCRKRCPPTNSLNH